MTQTADAQASRAQEVAIPPKGEPTHLTEGEQEGLRALLHQFGEAFEDLKNQSVIVWLHPDTSHHDSDLQGIYQAYVALQGDSHARHELPVMSTQIEAGLLSKCVEAQLAEADVEVMAVYVATKR